MPVILPFDSHGNQDISVTLDGMSYRFRTYYTEGQHDCWLLDIYDSQGVPLLVGIPIVPGAPNLLAGQGDKFQRVQLACVVTDGTPFATDALGNGTQLIWFGEGEENPYAIGDPLIDIPAEAWAFNESEDMASDHSTLINRELANQHPQSAITDLVPTLNSIQATANSAMSLVTTANTNASQAKTIAEEATQAVAAEAQARAAAVAGVQVQVDAKANAADLGGMALVDDAPENGNEYVRKNRAWVPSTGGSGGALPGGNTLHDFLTGTDADGVGEWTSPEDAVEFLPKASATGYGVVKVDGETIVESDGVLTVVGGGGGEGTTDHRQLSNRDAAGSHPSTAVSHGAGTVSSEIEDLKTADAALLGQIAALDQSKAGVADLSAETSARSAADSDLQVQITTLGLTKANSTDLGELAYEDDAPADGKQYARKDNAWAEMESSGGETIVHSSTTGRDLPNQHPAPAINVGTEASPVGLDVKLAEMDAATADETTARIAADDGLQDQIDTLDQDKADASAIADLATKTELADGLAEKADADHTQAIATIDGLQDALDTKAPQDSPAFTGTPTVPTATAGTNTTQAASTQFVQTAVAGVGLKRVTGTLTAAGWSGSAAPWTQTVTMANDEKGAAGLSAGATMAQYEAAANAGVWVSARTASNITFSAAFEKPAVNIPVEYVGA